MSEHDADERVGKALDAARRTTEALVEDLFTSVKEAGASPESVLEAARRTIQALYGEVLDLDDASRPNGLERSYNTEDTLRLIDAAL